MNKYTTWWFKGLRVITKFLSSIHWNGLRALFNDGVYYDLTEEDHDELRQLLAKDRYIILTYTKSHLTTPLIGILSWIKTRKWPGYVHALMNIDHEDDPKNWNQFRLMEATNSGVHWSSFMKVFDCDHVCLLKPKNISSDEWNAVMDGLLSENGKQYDDLFDLADAERVSCVEMCRHALQKNPNYAIDFANFEAMIQKVGNLTPQMFRECPDFEVVFERAY